MDTNELADRIEAALNLIDDPAVVFDPTTPNLNAWPQPGVRREFAEWLAERVSAR
jgi:tetrahydromethanopterin S-methyltransferase subunit B